MRQAQWRAYVEANREKVREARRKQKARRYRRMVEGGRPILVRDWKRLCHRYGGLCAYCRIQPATEQDHVIPLSRDGRHTIGNVLPACRSCNAAKSDKLLAVWRYSSLTQIQPVT